MPIRLNTWYAAFAILAALQGEGCIKSIAVTTDSVSPIEDWKPSMSPWPRVHPGDTRDFDGGWAVGPMLAVAFSSDTDLETIARRTGTHHVQANVYACGSEPDTRSILDVFKSDTNLICSVFVYADDTEPRTTSQPTIYRIYVPSRISALESCSNVSAQPELRGELNRIEKDGLCVTIGGGSMAYTGFESNTISIAVRNEDGVLVPVNSSD